MSLDELIQDRVDTQPNRMWVQPAVDPTPSGCRRWFVLATKPRAERRAHANLHLKGFRPYLPLITVRKRGVNATIPLFPGYCFVNLDPTKPWYPIRYAPGAFQLLTINGIPIPCPSGAVEAIQALDAQRATPMPESSYWAPGMACSLAVGTSAAVPGVVLDVRDDMAFVSTLMFGHLREISVSVDCLRARDE